ncbi:MAG TPA: CapA family protein [Bryobacteraceae bacterium]|nr:CapA family protein [Bryobacteraceae bacterium]
MKKAMAVMLLFSGLSLAAGDSPWHWTGSGKSAVTLLLLGDVSPERRADPVASLEHVSATLREADLAYGNLEGLLIKSEGPDNDIPDKSGWQYIGPEAVKVLKAGNIPVVGVANNVPYGLVNVEKSLAVLDANSILHTGAGANINDAHKPAIIERKGVKFGFLQYTAKWYDEQQQIATADHAGVARIKSTDGKMVDPGDLERMREDIRKLRPLVDVLVVSSHNRDGQGRTTSAATPSDRGGSSPASLTTPIPLGPSFSQREDYERQVAYVAIDAGADIVYGHGSHVVKGVEVYKGKPIMYCLGDFVTDWIRMRPNKEGLITRVVVQGKKVSRVSIAPLTRDENNNVLILDPSEGAGAKLMDKVKSLSGDTPLRIDGEEAILIEHSL